MDVVFTIVSRNYAAQAASLMESLASAEPAARRVVIATDGPIPGLAGRAEVIEAQAFTPDFGAMSVYYDALELNTAVKPHAFRMLLSQPDVTAGVYLDPDIWVYRPLDEVREGLARAQLCLTPHLTRPLAGEAEPNDHTILRSGVYNLGFMAARAEPTIFDLLDWWGRKCRFDCRVDFAAGLFTDQRWMDLAPGFVDSLARLRQPTLNLAYWNIEGRDLAKVDGRWRVDGEPLGFFHFSGFDPARPGVFSKHQNRTQAAPGSPLATLLADYAQAMIRNGHAEARATPYAFDRFASGRAITPAMRRRALRAARAGEAAPQGLDAASEAWFDAPDPEAAVLALPDVSRVMNQVWGAEPAAAGFDRETTEGRLAFHAWFADQAPDPASAEAGRRLLDAWRSGARRPDPSAWRDTPWTGPAAQVWDWVRQPVDGAPPRACSALLAARADLRQRFSGDATGLLAWCLGVEATAGRFAPDLLPKGLIDDLAAHPEGLEATIGAAWRGRGGDDLKRRLFAGFDLAHAARWPSRLAEASQAEFLRPVAGHPAPFIALFTAIWESRSDLQRQFPLDGPAGRLRFLRWLVGGGLDEYGVAFAALPATVRHHPWTRLALRTVRRRPAAPSIHAAGACATLVVTEAIEALKGARLPAGTLVLEAASGRFRHPDGAAATAPAQVARLCFLTDPGLAPADAIGLHARGVAWSRTAGVWSDAQAARLADNDPALGFVDEVWTPDGHARTPRPVRALASDDALEAALRAAVTT